MEPKATDPVHRWPCAQCGAQLRFAPGQTDLVCDHCGHVQAIPQAAGRRRARALQEHDLAAGLRDDLPVAAMESVQTTTCTSCGAQIEFQGATHATECPFCASPVAVDSGRHRLIKPQALVPFRVTETQARKALNDWLGNRWFAPSSLLEYARKGRAMSGMYVPFWTFDAASASDYTGQRGEHYYETEMVRVTVNGRSQMQPRQVQRTRWYPASGHVARDFNDVLVMGSTSLPARLGNDLTPWDLTALVPYDPDYLAGFTAEGYTVALTEADGQSKAIMARVIEQDVRRDIGGDDQRVQSVDTRFSDETFKHILLPVWMAAYKYGGKSYRFLINGQTGEVQGERPYSAVKIAFAVLVLLALVLGAIYLNDPANLGLPRPAWMD